MKRITIYRLFTILITTTVLFVACTKDPEDVRLEPKLSTSDISNVKSDSAYVTGFTIAGSDYTERGICYDIVTEPTTSSSKVAYTENTTTATYVVKIGDLAYATKYYARAYAIYPNVTIYGEEVSFTTLPVKPTVTTDAITNITGKTATGGGNVTVTGGATVTERGICWSLNHNPTISDTKVASGNGTGAYTANLTNLAGNKLYYVRAYATNSAGTSYGPEVSFTTLVALPTVTTTSVTNITKTTASSGGNVTDNGGATITARGLVYSTTANPTTADNVIDGGLGIGAFTSELTGLSINTTYHIRAYATNSTGTAYGSDIQFTTLANITKFWVVGDYNGWTNSDAALYIISTASSAGAAEGYIYLTTGSIKLCTDHSWDDAHTFGDDGSGGLTNPGGNITVASNGYYLIKANLNDMTYSLTKTNWGIVGNATPGGWGADTPMEYNSTSKLWTLGATLSQQTPPGDGLKFRSNNDWNYNYGDTGADGTLEPGGTNIGIAAAADYAITLDLSHPNEYTYSINRWGLIGDATPGGWGTDTQFTWDGINKVFTATLALTTAGTFKIRANGDWALNYGGAIGSLTAGGANMTVSTAGTYTITFDPWAVTATITLITKK